jgi:hypothetical protein
MRLAFFRISQIVVDDATQHCSAKVLKPQNMDPARMQYIITLCQRIDRFGLSVEIGDATQATKPGTLRLYYNLTLQPHPLAHCNIRHEIINVQMR